MQIIVEGPDGSGKSTLVRALEDQFKWVVVPGKGPEKFPGEIAERATLYLQDSETRERLGGFKPHIFDRHPCVSHLIYSQFTEVTSMPADLVARFYKLPSIFVYCQGTQNFSDSHEEKEYDSREHLMAIRGNHARIREQYDAWAAQHAHFIYRMDQFLPVDASHIINHLRVTIRKAHQ